MTDIKYYFNVPYRLGRKFFDQIKKFVETHSTTSHILLKRRVNIITTFNVTKFIHEIPQ